MPAGIYVRETLLTRLIEQLDNPHLVPLHRIDRATAGLVMLSPNPKTRSQYQALFRNPAWPGASARPTKRWHPRCRS